MLINIFIDLKVLVSTAKNTEKSFSYTFLNPWLGFGLLTRYAIQEKAGENNFVYLIYSLINKVMVKNGK
jgi:hypothetical protein